MVKIDRYAKVNIELEQIPNVIFPVKAFILKKLPVHINLGLEFLQANNTSINFKKSILNIAKHEIEIPEKKFFEKLPKPDKIISESVKRIKKDDSLEKNN